MKKTILLIVLILCALISTGYAAEPKKRILIYGDSNTFGWKDDSGIISRLPLENTWPEKLQALLGDQYEIITEALSGRTTDRTNINSGTGYISGAGMDGTAYLPAALSSHMPLDLVIIMLGTNDLNKQYDKSAQEISQSVEKLALIAANGEWQTKMQYENPKVLLLSPPKLNLTHSKYKEYFAGSLKKSEQLSPLLKQVAEKHGFSFFDVAAIIPFAEADDEIHFTENNHKTLALAMTKEIKQIFNDTAPLHEVAGPFAKGQPNSAYARYFTGNSYLNMLSTQGVIIGNVTFEPGCRNNWHIHHATKGGGQILLCTAGEGWYQEWGKPAQKLKTGDTVFIPAGIKHWHGASKDSWFVHLAVEVPGENTKNQWLEPVADAEYGKLE